MTVKEFYDFIIENLETIISQVVMENPDAKGEFPCIVAQAPTRYDIKLENNTPILSRFSITCEAWTKKKSTSIELADKIDQVLLNYNFIRMGTPIDLYDDNTMCHRYGGSYEVFYNAITNSLEKIR